VQVVNVINADENGGTSHTEITTNIDGEVKTETKDQIFAPGEEIVVTAAAHATSGVASSSVTTASTRASIILEFISQLLHSVFGIFFR
jgi:pentose-5-phosphate-3-epimerase